MLASFAKNIIVLSCGCRCHHIDIDRNVSRSENAKYEIGVLLSLGESRIKVILQFFTEIAICMFFALGIAAASGNVVGNIVGEQLLAQQTTTEQADAGMNGPEGMPVWATAVLMAEAGYPLFYTLGRSTRVSYYGFIPRNRLIGIVRCRDQLWVHSIIFSWNFAPQSKKYWFLGGIA